MRSTIGMVNTNKRRKANFALGLKRMQWLSSTYESLIELNKRTPLGKDYIEIANLIEEIIKKETKCLTDYE